MPGTPLHITASARINAEPDRIYDLIADYRNGHPRILPRQFVRLDVESGGKGAGTVFLCELKLLGRVNAFRAIVSEPRPGRVLVETSLEGPSVVTTFTVAPVDGRRAADVTIASEFEIPGGVIGRIQRALTPRLLLPIYREELDKLAACAASA